MIDLTRREMVKKKKQKSIISENRLFHHGASFPHYSIYLVDGYRMLTCVCMYAEEEEEKAQFVLYISQPYQSITLSTNPPTYLSLFPSRCLGKIKRERRFRGSGPPKTERRHFIYVEE
ncbi:hypothetical protein ACMFMG_000910 [Clarireedia jacksonii]